MKTEEKQDPGRKKLQNTEKIKEQETLQYTKLLQQNWNLKDKLYVPLCRYVEIMNVLFTAKAKLSSENFEIWNAPVKFIDKILKSDWWIGWRHPATGIHSSQRPVIFFVGRSRETSEWMSHNVIKTSTYLILPIIKDFYHVL